VKVLREMNSPDERSPIARGMEMVARVMAASLMMVLPGLGGQWLDRQLGSSWLVLAGFAFGISVSIYYLIVITRPAKNPSNQRSREQNTGRGDNHQ